MFVFDAEKWIYERKAAYPLVDCVKGKVGVGIWENFNFYPVIKNKDIQPNDIIIVKDDDVKIIQNLNTIIKFIPKNGNCTHIAVTLTEITTAYYDLDNKFVYNNRDEDWYDSDYSNIEDLLNDYVFVYNIKDHSYQFKLQ